MLIVRTNAVAFRRSSEATLMKLRVGLVGLGNAWEVRHRPALRALSDRFEVRAVCEPVAHRAEIAARDFGADAVDGFRALAERDDIDAVLVLSGQWFGALPILAACDAGKAVYCAAALDFDPTQARQIKQRVEASGVAFMAEFPRRQAPATLRLKELIATQLGQPAAVVLPSARAHRAAPRPAGRRRPTPVSRTHDLVELVDWCRYVAGCEPTSVLGLTHVSQTRAEEIDYEMMSLDFSGPSRPGTRDHGPDQFGPLHAGLLARGRGLSPAGRAASGLRARHRLYRSAVDADLVRQGGPAHGIARQRAARGRADALAVPPRRHQPGAQHQRTGRRLSRDAHRAASPPQPRRRLADHARRAPERRM